MNRAQRRFIAAAGVLLIVPTGLGIVAATERRAPSPTFSGERFRDTFFDSAAEAIRGQRPRLGQPPQPSDSRPVPSRDLSSRDESASTAAKSPFTGLISPTSLEDEIKRVRLQFDAAITTPTAFRSGDFQQARLHLTTLAALFAVVAEHDGDVRWKADAAAARDLFARSAANCKSGSAQVYNETKLRKADLEDLVSGSGLADRQAELENDWGLIADRVPLMTYAERLLDGPLKEGTRDAEAIASLAGRVRRSAELLAMVGQILKTEGLADADDADYAALCDELITASRAVSRALDREDAEAVRRGAGAVSQSCSKCHESYR